MAVTMVFEYLKQLSGGISGNLGVTANYKVD